MVDHVLIFQAEHRVARRVILCCIVIGLIHCAWRALCARIDRYILIGCTGNLSARCVPASRVVIAFMFRAGPAVLARVVIHMFVDVAQGVITFRVSPGCVIITICVG